MTLEPRVEENRRAATMQLKVKCPNDASKAVPSAKNGKGPGTPPRDPWNEKLTPSSFGSPDPDARGKANQRSQRIEGQDGHQRGRKQQVINRDPVRARAVDYEL